MLFSPSGRLHTSPCPSLSAHRGCISQRRCWKWHETESFVKHIHAVKGSFNNSTIDTFSVMQLQLWTSLEAPCKALCKQKEWDRRDGWVSPQWVAVHDVHYMVLCKERFAKCSRAIRKRSPGELFVEGSRCSGPSNCEVLVNLTSLTRRKRDCVLSNNSPHPFVIASRSACELSRVP